MASPDVATTMVRLREAIAQLGAYQIAIEARGMRPDDASMHAPFVRFARQAGDLLRRAIPDGAANGKETWARARDAVRSATRVAIFVVFAVHDRRQRSGFVEGGYLMVAIAMFLLGLQGAFGGFAEFGELGGGGGSDLRSGRRDDEKVAVMEQTLETLKRDKDELATTLKECTNATKCDELQGQVAECERVKRAIEEEVSKLKREMQMQNAKDAAKQEHTQEETERKQAENTKLQEELTELKANKLVTKDANCDTRISRAMLSCIELLKSKISETTSGSGRTLYPSNRGSTNGGNTAKSEQPLPTTQSPRNDAMNTYRGEVDAVCSMMKEKDEDIASLTRKLNESSEQHATEIERLRRAKNDEIERMKKQLSENTAKLEAARTTTEATEKKHLQAMQAAQKQAANAQAELEKCKARTEALENELNDMQAARKQAATAQAELEAAANAATKLAGEQAATTEKKHLQAMQAAQKQAANAQAELEKCKARTEALENELNDMQAARKQAATAQAELEAAANAATKLAGEQAATAQTHVNRFYTELKSIEHAISSSSAVEVTSRQRAQSKMTNDELAKRAKEQSAMWGEGLKIISMDIVTNLSKQIRESVSGELATLRQVVSRLQEEVEEVETSRPKIDELNINAESELTTLGNRLEKILERVRESREKGDADLKIARNSETGLQARVHSLEVFKNALVIASGVDKKTGETKLDELDTNGMDAECKGVLEYVGLLETNLKDAQDDNDRLKHLTAELNNTKTEIARNTDELLKNQKVDLNAVATENKQLKAKIETIDADVKKKLNDVVTELNAEVKKQLECEKLALDSLDVTALLEDTKTIETIKEKATNQWKKYPPKYDKRKDGELDESVAFFLGSKLGSRNASKRKAEDATLIKKYFLDMHNMQWCESNFLPFMKRLHDFLNDLLHHCDALKPTNLVDVKIERISETLTKMQTEAFEWIESLLSSARADVLRAPPKN